MDFFEDHSWDLIDYSSFIDDVCCTDLYLPNTSTTIEEIDGSHTLDVSQEKECAEKECPRKRGRDDPSNKMGSKACRERLRREKLNDKFAELCSVLEPGRPIKTDKLAILSDAIRILNQLRADTQEYKDTNEKLLEEIRTLKEDKNELREEKLHLQADKENVEHHLKAMAASPAGFVPAHPASYQPGASKMPVFPSYSLVPMWHYLPPPSCDTSKDHELRPPAA
uniref:Transcription factor bHLH3 n=1 Tax=Nothapodytes nimmoniana TaxID=159386 RepID=A0A9E8Z0D9_NOTNI|nr:transcription factor bHLH3 [Nothapodytes nimmoniana]